MVSNQTPQEPRRIFGGVEISLLADMFAAGRSSMVLLASRGINMLAQFVLVLFISRHLGQEGLGIFTFVLSTVILGTYLSNFGLDTLVTREAASNPARGRDLASNILGLKLFTSLIAFFLINGIFFFSPLETSIRSQLLIYSLVIFFSAISNVFWFYCDAFDRFSLHGALWAATHILRTLVAGMILFLGGGLPTAFLGLVAAELLGCLGSRFLVNRRLDSLRFKFHWSEWGGALIRAWPLAVYSLLGAIGFRIDVVLLQMLRGAHEVGLYGAAFKLVEVFHVLPSSLALVHFPRFSRAHAVSGPAGTRHLVRRVIGVSLSLGIPLCLALYFAAPVVIRLLYGTEFLQSVVPLRILVLKISLLFINLPLSYVLIAIGAERRATLWAAISAVMNIAANLLLVPSQGAVGAAWASVLAEILLLIGFLAHYLRVKEQPAMAEHEIDLRSL